MQFEAGWLLRDDTLPWKVGPVVDVSPETRTRREEYHWVRRRIDPTKVSTVLDAASGYVPTWHMLPEILAWDGYDVTACDWDERSLSMPHGNLGVGIVPRLLPTMQPRSSCVSHASKSCSQQTMVGGYRICLDCLWLRLRTFLCNLL
jgi:hypothetical protein